MSDHLFYPADIASIESLALELGYPESVISPMKRAATSIPASVPIAALSDPWQAQAAWEQTTKLVPSWQEDNGMALLAITTAAACSARRQYEAAGISDTIFLETMKCIPRFLYESKKLFGRWTYDRGFWTWRQTGGLIFRLGTLEFEYRTLEYTEPIPDGLRSGDPVINVHIPSDAKLSREFLDASYRQAREFFSGSLSGPWVAQPPKDILCDSWLLAPTLDLLLPETSGIRIFASDYQRYHQQQDSDAFFRWLYQLPTPVAYDTLPENTSLQRKLKQHLLAGGHMGMAWGRLKSSSIFFQ